MNLVELDQALRKLRLSGMADVLDTRLLQAQTEQMAPLDLLAALVTDELQRREDRLLAPATQAGALSRHRPLARRLRLRLQQEDQPRPRLRARHRAFRRPARRRTPARPARYGQESSRPGHRTGRHPAGLPRHLPRSARLPGRTRRSDARRYPQGLSGRADPRTLAHHRRPRHAQAAAYRRRGPARADHAPLRAGLHHAHLESSRRGLGKAPRRHRRRHGATRPAPTSRTRAQVRTAQLAHQGPDNRLSSNRCGRA